MCVCRVRIYVYLTLECVCVCLYFPCTGDDLYENTYMHVLPWWYSSMCLVSCVLCLVFVSVYLVMDKNHARNQQVQGIHHQYMRANLLDSSL